MATTNSEHGPVRLIDATRDYLKTVPPAETEEQRAERETRDEERRIHNQRLQGKQRFTNVQYAVGPRYANAKLEDFQCTHPEQIAAMADLEKYDAAMIENVNAGRGLVFYGRPGTGKDHLMIAMLRRAMWRDCFTGKWINGLDLYGDVRDSIGADRGTENDLIRELVEPRILAISDPLPPWGTLTPFQASIMFRVIDGRYRRCNPTWVTMNVANSAEANERLGAALVDRLRDGALSIACNWPSHRAGAKS